LQNAGGTVYPTDYPTAEYYVIADSAQDWAFTIKPADGYVIDKVYIDDVLNPIAAITGTYKFAGVKANHSIHATFKPIMYTITATAAQGGTITPGGNVLVPHGGSQTFLIVPDVGYYLDTVLVNGVGKGTINTYTFNNVKGDSTISAFFVKKKYTITTTTPGGNGIITPANPKVYHGDNQTLTFVPAPGYQVNKVKIDGVENLAAAQNGYYTFVNVTQPHTIEVTFIKMTFTIISTHTLGGVINPAGTAVIEYGDHSAIYVFLPESGYHVAQVLIDGVNNYQAIDDGLYRFLNVTANHTIHVIFAPDTHTIFATATTGGVITPSGIVYATTGETPTFNFRPETGYKLVRVLVNGFNMPGAVATESYTFPPIMANQTISAHFERLPLNVYLPAETGATVIPQPGYTTTVNHGAKFVFTVEFAAGYTQSNIVVRANGIVVTPVAGIYTINNITVDQTITVEGVEKNQYTIYVKAFAGGTITPNGTFIMNYGDAQLFTLVPGNGFKISHLLVNGIPTDLEGDTYLLENVAANTNVEAYFKSNIGIDDNEAVVTVYSYDNVVTIKNEALLPVKSVEIMDMTGRLVWSSAIATTEKTDIALSVAAGIYSVRVITESNAVSITKISIK
jgi:hypothetical protein